MVVVTCVGAEVKKRSATILCTFDMAQQEGSKPKLSKLTAGWSRSSKHVGYAHPAVVEEAARYRT